MVQDFDSPYDLTGLRMREADLCLGRLIGRHLFSKEIAKHHDILDDPVSRRKKAVANCTTYSTKYDLLLDFS